MIKFLAHRDGRPMIGLGLSKGNCQKLLEGRPIFIDLKVMMMDCEKLPDLNEATILIFGGETEEAMQEELGKIITKAPKISTHNEEN